MKDQHIINHLSFSDRFSLFFFLGGGVGGAQGIFGWWCATGTLELIPDHLQKGEQHKDRITALYFRLSFAGLLTRPFTSSL